MLESGRFTLVLSGGGMKGMAHIGVLRALEDRGLEPSLVVGTSMGSFIGAAWASGMPVSEMTRRARLIRRRDIFQIAHADMALRRMRSPAIYRREPLDALIRSVVGDRTFADLPRQLLVNTVDLQTGSQVLWGSPGQREARVADAVFASCALPGIFPPRDILGRACVDGATVDNLPVRAAAAAVHQPIIAVDVSSSTLHRPGPDGAGFASTYMRAMEILMQTMTATRLEAWTSPALVLVRPRVEHLPTFVFDRTDELLEAGRRATEATFLKLEAFGRVNGGGIYPKRLMRVTVDAGRCVGCGVCVRLAPGVFQMTGSGKAEVLSPRQVWSPIDGAYVVNCPSFAIAARPVESGPEH